MPDAGTIHFAFTMDPSDCERLRALFAPPERFELTMDDGTLIGVNGRRVGDSIEFDYTPEALELIERARHTQSPHKGN